MKHSVECKRLTVLGNCKIMKEVKGRNYGREEKEKTKKKKEKK